MPYDPPLLVVYTLALASVTRLVTGIDTITERPHTWFINRLTAMANWSMCYLDTKRWSLGWWTTGLIRGVTNFLSTMLSCHWCASFWIAGAALYFYQWWLQPAVLFLAIVFAIRFVIGYLVSASASGE